MARSWAELGHLSRAELISEYDRQSQTTTTESLAFIRDVIFQRASTEQNTRLERMTSDMARLTNQIRWLTVVITVLTAITTVAVFRGI
jgi:hypothetical protein